MLFLRTLQKDLCQIWSKEMVLAILAIGLTYIFVGNGFVHENSDLWQIVNTTVWGSTAFFTIELLPCFAFSKKIASDWNSRVTQYWIIRTGVERYTISKILVCAISGFITHFLGTICFVLYYLPNMKAYVDSYGTNIYAVDWMNKGYIVLGYFGFITDKSIGAAIVASLGMIVSIFFTHSYVAVASPLIVMLTISRLVYILNLPEYLNPSYWTHSLDSAGSAWVALLDKIVLIAVMLILFCVIGVAGMKRRVSHA